MKNSLKHHTRELLLAISIVVLIMLVGVRAPVFVSGASLGNLLTDSTLLIILALAQMLIIVTRGIDLSMASNLALSGMAAALLASKNPDLPLIVIVLAAAVIGLVLGLVNGYLIGYLELPAIVVTLGTMSVYRGLVFVLSGGAWVSSHQMPDAFIGFPLTRLFGITYLVWIAAAAILVAWYLAFHSRFGRDLFAIGNAPSSARYVGIPMANRLFWTYGLAGLVSGICGYLWVARYAVAYTEIAYGFEFTVIAACVIGGISIAGGTGTVIGAVLGALFLAVIGNALPVVKVSPFWQSALTGIVILAAVLINARDRKNAGRQILPLHLSRTTGHAGGNA
jgi:rhamnose transport system permease protein